MPLPWKESESEAAVNLSFSFRRPSTDCYRTARAGSVDEWIMTTDSQAASPYGRSADKAAVGSVEPWKREHAAISHAASCVLGDVR
jgi:hypothetical protein